jgi:hypothetical protein
MISILVHINHYKLACNWLYMNKTNPDIRQGFNQERIVHFEQ